MTDKLRIPPDQASYTSVFGNEVLRVQLDGGKGRYRRDLLGAWNTVTAQWTLDRLQYDYFTAFRRNKTENGAIPFLCDLIIDGSPVSEYSCYFIPETFQLISQSGYTYVVTAQLEVEPQDVDTTFDSTLVMMYDLYLDGSPGILAALSELINDRYPEEL